MFWPNRNISPLFYNAVQHVWCVTRKHIEYCIENVQKWYLLFFVENIAVKLVENVRKLLIFSSWKLSFEVIIDFHINFAINLKFIQYLKFLISYHINFINFSLKVKKWKTKNLNFFKNSIAQKPIGNAVLLFRCTPSYTFPLAAMFSVLHGNQAHYDTHSPNYLFIHCQAAS